MKVQRVGSPAWAEGIQIAKDHFREPEESGCEEAARDAR